MRRSTESGHCSQQPCTSDPYGSGKSYGMGTKETDAITRMTGPLALRRLGAPSGCPSETYRAGPKLQAQL